MGSAQERALLMETLDALRKRHTAQAQHGAQQGAQRGAQQRGAQRGAQCGAQRGVPPAWGAWETGSACSEPVE